MTEDLQKSISRKTLRAIIVKASAAAGCSAIEQRRLLASIKTADRFVVGDFSCNGVGCPLTMAGYWVSDHMPPRHLIRFAYKFDDLVWDTVDPSERWRCFPVWNIVD